MYQGLTTRVASCALCKKRMPKGTLVYFDSNKTHGFHLVHVVCLDKLRETVPAKPAPDKEIRSEEVLDPPF